MALTKIVDTFRVDAADSGPFDAQVHVQALTDGGFAYAWRERDVDGFGQKDRIHVRKFDADGNAVGSEIEIPGAVHEPGPHGSGTGHWRPTIAALADGGFAVEYNDLGMGTDYTNGNHFSSFWTWTAIFDASGTLIDQETPLGQPVQSTEQSNTIWGSAVASDGAGGYDHVLTQTVPYAEGPGGIRIVLNGVEVTRHQGILSNATDGYSISSSPIDVADHTDGAIATYVRSYYTGSAEGSDIWAITSTGFEFRVNELIAGNQTIGQEGEYLAQLSDGNYVLVWQDTNTTTDEATDPSWGVHARIFRGDGTFVTGDIILSTTPNNDETAPAVAAMSGGRWIAVWEDDAGNVAQVFSATGERLGGQIALGIGASGDSLTVTVLADDRIVFAFNDGGTTTSSQIWRFPDIYGTEAGETINGTTGDDLIYGLGGNDYLIGQAGDDRLLGGAGPNTLQGGLGDDTYVVENGGDTLIEAVGEGNDTVETELGVYFLRAANVENLTGTVNTGQALVGNALDNRITGGTGNDQMQGLAGNDTYVVRNSSDTIVEQVDGGIDTVETGLAVYILNAANVENLTGTVNTPQVLVGNALDNRITGGIGNDHMQGKLGNDTYIVLNSGDSIIEQTGEGTDTVETALAAYVLRAANVENLTGTSASAQQLRGNDLANRITGGVGNDTLAGGLGDDTYVLLNAGDSIVEAAGQGSDTVETALASYTLRAANVENLTGTSATGQQLRGSDFDNRITGGVGNDTLIGGLGNDTYVVLNAGDSIVEAAAQGTDTVETALSVYFLNAANVENLTYTGAGDFYGAGNAHDNVITGGTGNDILRGGLGADTLIGGAGNDRHLFDSAIGGGNIDAILGFASGSDRIWLDDSVFTQLGTGPLAANAFVIGTGAGDADDRILYDQASGALYYDADGNGAGAAVQFATLSGAPALAASDFVVI